MTRIPAIHRHCDGSIDFYYRDEAELRAQALHYSASWLKPYFRDIANKLRPAFKCALLGIPADTWNGWSGNGMTQNFGRVLNKGLAARSSEPLRWPVTFPGWRASIRDGRWLRNERGRPGGRPAFCVRRCDYGI
jgi:hypothetical protein